MGVQARSLGGEVRIDGGLTSVPNASPSLTARAAPPQVLRLQGTATSEGLRQAQELGFAARLAQHANGSATYSAILGVRSGVPESLVNNNLVGMALTLPAPFAKAADAALPVRLETAAVRATPLVPGADVWFVPRTSFSSKWAKRSALLMCAMFPGADARALRGAIAVGLAGDEIAPLPSEGVQATCGQH